MAQAYWHNTESHKCFKLLKYMCSHIQHQQMCFCCLQVRSEGASCVNALQLRTAQTFDVSQSIKDAVKALRLLCMPPSGICAVMMPALKDFSGFI